MRGEDHGCFTTSDESGVDVACYGLSNPTGVGLTTRDFNQVTPQPVVWDPENFEAFAVPRPAK